MIALWFTVGAFATYYTARAIAQEDGPWGVFDRLRLRFDSGYLGKGIRCVVCVSAYTALLWAIVLAAYGLIEPQVVPLVWFGLAGASAKLHEFWKR